MSKRSWGSVRKLPSGRWQVRYTGPDGRTYTARTEAGRSLTFDTKTYADAYLARVRADIQAGRWAPPDAAKSQELLHFREYAAAWLATRELGVMTRELYAGLLESFILPAFGDTPLTDITPAAVRAWHAKLGAQTGPTRRSHAYRLLRTILATAVADDVLATNPCRLRGASSARRARQVRPATLGELEAIAAAMPERYRLMVLLAAWCALRFGELAELRRSDVDVKNAVIHVRRGVVRPRSGHDGRLVKGPKSEAGKRDVSIPPHLLPAVKDHLWKYVLPERGALLFPSATDPTRQMAPSTLYGPFWVAREAADRGDLRFHDLRHTGATLAAVSGATLRELMARLGHSTPSAAMIYQHAAADRDKVIAEALSKLAAGTVTPIAEAKERRRKTRGSA